jgi:cation diffusion facilitator CzcD-associated flavoprotein CzcO
MLEWLIVGGGIQGTYLAIFLLGRMAVKPEALRILDPHDQMLTVWEHHTANAGMEYLRSAHAHNLHFDPWSLATFVRTRAGAPLARFIEPYGRPSLELFRAHSQRLIERYKLEGLHIRGRAAGLVKLADGWRVETGHGGIQARKVILAIGATEQPLWPEWAIRLRRAGAPVHHVFGMDFERAALNEWQQAVVLGGGITAAQTALAMAADGPVTLLTRHITRIHDFDSDPRWIDPRQLAEFHATQDYTIRRSIIAGARHRGSMPSDVAAELQQAVLEARLLRRMEQVTGAEVLPSGMIKIELADSAALETDCLVLATGFEASRPGGAWLDEAIAAQGLPVAPDGYPIVDPTLCWSRGLYVTGPLAELEVGPTARNIIGVRLAAERIRAGVR